MSAKGCGVCGGLLVSIRGKVPHTPDRLVCPTCLAERMDRINEVSSPHYGVAYEAKPSTTESEDKNG